VEDRSFEFRFTKTYRIVSLPFGVTPSTCEVRVGADRLLVRFGLWHVETTLDNIADVDITGPYTLLKTAGPAHLSLADRGITFATNGDRGVCLRMREPVAGIDPFGLVRHPGVTVTVRDCDGLAAAVA
jgi:hypothetical protein